MTDFARLIAVLVDSEVDFILVGGVAATVHGSSRLTLDVDVVYDRHPANLERIATAFEPYEPYPRGAPSGLPFRWDVETLRRGLNFNLTTKLGELDLLGDVPGGRDFGDLVEDAIEVEIFGRPCLCLGLDRLIELKRAAGRPKDYEALAELEALREERS